MMKKSRPIQLPKIRTKCVDFMLPTTKKTAGCKNDVAIPDCLTTQVSGSMD